MPVWETLDSHLLWQSRWYNLREDRVRTDAGHEFTYTIVDHPGAVWIVPVTSEGQVVLVRHYRYPVCYQTQLITAGLPCRPVSCCASRPG